MNILRLSKVSCKRFSCPHYIAFLMYFEFPWLFSGSFFAALPFVLVLPYVYHLGTPAFRRWALQYIPIPVIQQLRRAVAIQNAQAEEVLRSRQELISSGADLGSEVGRGKDVLTLLSEWD